MSILYSAPQYILNLIWKSFFFLQTSINNALEIDSGLSNGYQYPSTGPSVTARIEHPNLRSLGIIPL